MPFRGGPIEGLVNGAKSIFINDVQLQNDNDSYSQRTEWEEFLGEEEQPPTSLSNTTETETAVNVQVSIENGAVTRDDP